MWIGCRVICPNNVNGMANSVDPDQRSSLIRVYTVFSELSVRKVMNITVIIGHRMARIFYPCHGLKMKFYRNTNEPCHDKTNNMAFAPSEDSDQSGHPPSLIRVFAVRMKKAWVLSYPLRAPQRLWSDWADAQADLSLRWAHSHFVGFVMMRLKYSWQGVSIKPCALKVVLLSLLKI